MAYNRYAMFAGYNQWANELVFEAANELSDRDYRADFGVFFKSVHGTLNHMLGADQFWMHRFTGKGTFPNALNAILYEDFDGLQLARQEMDRRIMNWVNGLDENDLKGILRYTPVTSPVPVEELLAPALDHFFNHQTHHRGQIHAVMTRIKDKAPSLDLVYYNRKTYGNNAN